MNGWPLIEFRDVWKTYGRGEAEVHALAGIDLTIEAGEFVAIMGPSGSGKSTAMNIIGCLDTPTSGRYAFQGVDAGRLDRASRAALRNLYIGFVFQGYNLLARTTAAENVELPLIYRGVGRAPPPPPARGGPPGGPPPAAARCTKRGIVVEPAESAESAIERDRPRTTAAPLASTPVASNV